MVALGGLLFLMSEVPLQDLSLDSTGFLVQGRGHGISRGFTTKLTTSKRHDHTDDQSKTKARQKDADWGAGGIMRRAPESRRRMTDMTGPGYLLRDPQAFRGEASHGVKSGPYRGISPIKKRATPYDSPRTLGIGLR